MWFLIITALSTGTLAISYRYVIRPALEKCSASYEQIKLYNAGLSAMKDGHEQRALRAADQIIEHGKKSPGNVWLGHALKSYVCKRIINLKTPSLITKRLSNPIENIIRK